MRFAFDLTKAQRYALLEALAFRDSAALEDTAEDRRRAKALDRVIEKIERALAKAEGSR